jgi:hypothetical protein
VRTEIWYGASARRARGKKTFAKPLEVAEAHV